MLLPFLRSAQIAKIWEKEINFEEKIRGEVVRLYIELSSEKHDIINLHFFFTVADQKRLA